MPFKFQKVPKPRMRVLVMYGPMCTWMCCRYIGILGFGTFLELARHLQSTRSRRLVNGFWWFLVQNKVESLLVSFLLFPAHFCLAENNKNVQWSKKCWFSLAQLPNVLCLQLLEYSTLAIKWEPIFNQTASIFTKIPILSNSHFTAKK